MIAVDTHLLHHCLLTTQGPQSPFRTDNQPGITQ